MGMQINPQDGMGLSNGGVQINPQDGSLHINMRSMAANGNGNGMANGMAINGNSTSEFAPPFDPINVNVPLGTVGLAGWNTVNQQMLSQTQNVNVSGGSSASTSLQQQQFANPNNKQQQHQQ